jgi:hypothetical protein
MKMGAAIGIQRAGERKINDALTQNVLATLLVFKTKV